MANLSAPFIRRSVATTLLMVGLLIFGIVGYFKLPMSDLPNIDFPTISVSASLPGASPETMATAVATPLEQQFSSISGISSMTSTSSLGSTQITLQFVLDRNIDSAAQDVEAAIAAAERHLPQSMPTPPSYKKVNPADAPIFFIALTSTTLPLSTVDKYAETFLAQRISMVDGVALVNVYGSQKYAVRVQVNPDLMAARNIGIDQVENTIQAGNVNLPTGSLQGNQQSFLIQTEGQLKNAAAYRSLIVAYQNGAPVRLNDIGQVIDSVQNNLVASWFSNARGIVLAIQRQPGSNTIATVNQIKALLPAFQTQLPAGIKMSIVYDRSQSIRESVDEVQKTLIVAAILVILVIFIFLRNLSATVIPSIALPMSIIGTFAIMHLLGFSLDNLSLLALTLAVGYVVDDAIVMLENIYRHIEHGETPLEAAYKGSREIAFTILSITIALIVVFIPILFMGGILGRLLNEFALTICIAILLSGIISLVLTPMLCSKFLKPPAQQEHGRWYYIAENSFNKLLSIYERSLRWTLEHKRFTFYTFIGTLLLSAILFYVIPKGFMPSEDTGQLFAYTQADPAVSFAQMSALQQKVANVVVKNPNIDSFISSVGSGGFTSSTNAGRLFIRLKPLDERSASADEIIQQLRPELANVPGISTYLQNVPSLRIGGRLSQSTYQYTLQDIDIEELNKWTGIFQQNMAKLPGFQDVTSDLLFTGPQIVVNINRDKAAALGVSAEQIENALADAYGTKQISTIYTSIDAYEVILELQPEYQQNPAELAKLYVHSTNGTLVPLSAVVTFSRGIGPLTINHQGELPSVTISFNLAPHKSLGNAVDEINALKDKLNPPSSLSANFQGTAQAFQNSLKGLGLLLLIAILVIYIVLGILYESFIHPLTILSGLPAAAIGALLMLIICNNNLNLYSFIGIIMLIGIVKKNAIMMIDFAIEAQRTELKSPTEAIYQACVIRFRPIIMTTMAALMGALPIVFAWGAGASTRRPLGLAVVGGLLLSQILTLYITPVLYIYLENLSTHKKQKKL